LNESNDKFILTDILLEISRIREYELELVATGWPHETAREDSNYQSILFTLMKIGELVKKLSRSLRESNPSLEWEKIIGLRNKIVHAYKDISENIIIDTLNQSLDSLQIFCSDYLKSQVG